MKLFNIDGENLHIIQKTWGILITFSGDVTYDNINIKKKQKKTGPYPVSKKYIFGKARERMSNWTSQPFKD